MVWRQEPRRVREDAPNVLVVLIDDVGFAQTDTFGGEMHTPTLSRLRREGIAYNSFHTTSICSPSRAALLTGRNHHRVGSGTIAERATDFDGYTGVIPKTSATIPEVLHHYGYASAAFGKWHNTPVDKTTAMGPFDRWPTGHGFDYFYGFMGGESSQYEPRLYENTNPIEPPRSESYHLTEDLADRAITWLRRHRSSSPDKPFFMYWAPGAVHGPHHVPATWSDKYRGKFNDGWDAYRKRVFERQKALGWIPASAQLTERDPTMASWESIPESERPFQTRLMEIFAGFVEHTDAQVGRLVDELERLGERDNTLIFFIWGDNGASAEGQRGTISELLAQNNIPNSMEQQLSALKDLGGIKSLGTHVTDSMYHAGWAWAGNTPFRATKLVASHFGGTRNPLVISWPKKITPDAQPRTQFHHINDVAPTLYELIGVTPPREVNGFEQDPLDGVSMAYSFQDPSAPTRKETQYFENNGSRGIYHDGWFAGTFGPLIPWNTALSAPKVKDWDPRNDVWELYDLSSDFSQAVNLAEKHPERLEKMKALFLDEAQANKVLPIGAGLWTRFHPRDAIRSPYTSWMFDGNSTRIPELAGPALGKRSTHVTVKLHSGANASGVLYAVGGSSGGVSVYVDQGKLVYEYNLLLLERTIVSSKRALSAGEHTVEVHEDIPNAGGPGAITLKIDGKDVANGNIPRTVPGAFTASETLDIGRDLGAPVSRAYSHRAPFAFNGQIKSVEVRYENGHALK